MPDPGWYTDPLDPHSARWWDGAGWTEHSIPLAPFASYPGGSPKPRRRGASRGALAAIVGIVAVAGGLAAWFLLRGDDAGLGAVKGTLEKHGVSCAGGEVPAGTPEAVEEMIRGAESESVLVAELTAVLDSAEDAEMLGVIRCAPSGWLLRRGDEVLAIATTPDLAATVRDLFPGGVPLVLDAPEILDLGGEDQRTGITEQPPESPVPSTVAPPPPSPPPPPSQPPSPQPTAAPAGGVPGGGAVDSSRRVACEMGATTVRNAIDAYRTLNGTWPSSMDELVGDWLGEVPEEVTITFTPGGGGPPLVQWSAQCAGLAGP